jgi:hypothetical protein
MTTDEIVRELERIRDDYDSRALSGSASFMDDTIDELNRLAARVAEVDEARLDLAVRLDAAATERDRAYDALAILCPPEKWPDDLQEITKAWKAGHSDDRMEADQAEAWAKDLKAERDRLREAGEGLLGAVLATTTSPGLSLSPRLTASLERHANTLLETLRGGGE